MVKHAKLAKKPKTRQIFIKRLLFFTLGAFCGTLLLGAVFFLIYETQFADRVYPGISISGIPFGGQTRAKITEYWIQRNAPFQRLTLTFQFENHIATISGASLDIGFDATLSASQAFAVGRSGNTLTDTYHKFQAWQSSIDLTPFFRWQDEVLDDTLETLALGIDIEPENALFEFQSGRVSVFKPAKIGREVDREAMKRTLIDQLELLATVAVPRPNLLFTLPVAPKRPLLQTNQANNFGIEESIGEGVSYFRGSIPGRIHNIALAASRVNGVLIPPGATFSFNNAVGDISAATGYKQAYVIKSGRTVLDDGGGVCQVSTTLFRAALNTGLPIAERHAHSYRVQYYEQGGWKPGFDATVYAPNYDLKITNDTPAYILIQATTDTKNFKLIFELYGKRDGRTVEISPARLWDSRPAPPELHQDDPTLSAGTVKQVDWAAAGIKAAIDYTVKRGEEEVFKKTFSSNFIPWQAVFLHGTGPAQ